MLGGTEYTICKVTRAVTRDLGLSKKVAAEKGNKRWKQHKYKLVKFVVTVFVIFSLDIYSMTLLTYP